MEADNNQFSASGRYFLQRSGAKYNKVRRPLIYLGYLFQTNKLAQAGDILFT